MIENRKRNEGGKDKLIVEGWATQSCFLIFLLLGYYGTTGLLPRIARKEKEKKEERKEDMP